MHLHLKIKYNLARIGIKIAILAGVAVFCSIPLAAQISLSVYSGGYFNVTDYGGYVSDTDNHRFHIQWAGTNINVPNWAIKARINGPIQASGGQQNVGGIPFPADKISFRFTRDDGNSPTLAEINAPMTPIPFVSGGEVALIPSSNAPLFLQSPNNDHRQLNLFFEIKIEGGGYLDQLKNKQAYQTILYNVPITFTLYNAQGVPIGSKNVEYRIQLNQNLTGNPGTPPQYSLEIVGGARDGLLDFNSLASYMNGVSVNYNDAVKVNSSTGFELTTKSQFNEFGNATGDVLPINILQVQLQAGTNAPIGAVYPSIQLSTTPQLVMRSDVGKTSTMFMNIKYSVEGNDDRLLQAKGGNYATVLIYQLTPR